MNAARTDSVVDVAVVATPPTLSLIWWVVVVCFSTAPATEDWASLIRAISSVMPSIAVLVR